MRWAGIIAYGVFHFNYKMESVPAAVNDDVEVVESVEGYPTTEEAFDSGWLKVSDLHEIYYEQSGKEDGNPVIYVHGGPGSGCSSACRRYFDPSVYRVVLLDQRGAGKSTPHAELKENTTWDLVEDLEKLRQHLGIDKWVVFGGSWGSTLSLVYAIKYTERVKALILRGIFTGRREEVAWLYEEGGASNIYPDYWKDFVSAIPKCERRDMVSAYYRRLTSPDHEVCLEAAKAWAQWECRISKMVVDLEKINTRIQNESWVLSFAKIECHYFVHDCWFDDPSYILNNVEKIRNVPGVIVQGRYDMVTPIKTAWELHEKWPEAELEIISYGAHSVISPDMRAALINAAERYKFS